MPLDHSSGFEKVDIDPTVWRDDPDILAVMVARGDVPATAFLLTLVEQGDSRVSYILNLLKNRMGRAHIVGITGVPGGGKSTLVDQLIKSARAEGLQVGVLAIDPSSSFTKGAILADRVRMQNHTGDGHGTFIRSLGSRGDMGGLSASTWDAARVMDASGRDIVFIETVGAGQVEVDIVGSAHTVVVVTVPGLGDSIQAIKAGLMEIGDIFVVNMADRPDARKAVRFLKSGVRPLNHDKMSWEIPVLTTIATTGDEVDKLWAVIRNHRFHLEATGGMVDRRLGQVRGEILRRLERLSRDYLNEWMDGNEVFDELVEEVVSGKLDISESVAVMWEKLRLAN